MAYLNANEYISNSDKYGFFFRRYGLIGDLHLSWNLGIEKK
tara:strand:+ start:1070 stop:1192 length:123 start_codon:yes stop_codon:yes gene_type:complete